MLLRPYRLPDGTQVIVRPIRPDDKAALRRGLRRMSPESQYQRFLAPKPDLSTAELRYLTEVDGHDHVAVVAVLAHRATEIVGVARFVRDPALPERAEAAITIGDPWQGLGLGRHLGLVLADLARERGIRAFTASLLAVNGASHRLFETISERLEAHVHDGLEELVAELAA